MNTLMNNHAVHGAMVAAPSAYVISTYGVNTPRSILGGLAIGGLVYYQMTSSEASEKVNRQVDVTDPVEVENIGKEPALAERNILHEFNQARQRKAQMRQIGIPLWKKGNRHVPTKVNLARANRLRHHMHEPSFHGFSDTNNLIHHRRR